MADEKHGSAVRDSDGVKPASVQIFFEVRQDGVLVMGTTEWGACLGGRRSDRLPTRLFHDLMLVNL